MRSGKWEVRRGETYRVEVLALAWLRVLLLLFFCGRLLGWMGGAIRCVREYR